MEGGGRNQGKSAGGGSQGWVHRDLTRVRHLRNYSWGSEPSTVAFVRESSSAGDEWGASGTEPLPPIPSPNREDSNVKSPVPESRLQTTPGSPDGGGMKHCICMVSDFFYPDAGGVENHMYMLSQCLLQLGHKVIVCTRARGSRQGVRWLTGGLKVYYLPLMPMPDVFSSGRVSLPTLVSSFPIFRNICIREQVTIVHGHQAFSIICHENLMHAGTLGLKTVFTDHSLFGFSDPSAIHMNKVLDFTLSCINHVICVSHTSKENTVLRANVEPEYVSVIPNAVDTSMFTPNPAARKSNCITIVCITRLVYRKGVDLMVEVIPAICKQFEHVNFIVGGDGPMRVALEQMRENNQLQDRVEMLGHVQHHDVRNVLVRGHIYLNCSLTEAFCIAILEAASCGLLVVSTKVGGVPEVMPSNMIKYARPDPKDLVDALKGAILKDVKDANPMEFHDGVKRMYSWHNVALRTCKVYDKISMDDPKTLMERIERSYSRGPVFGILIAVLVAMDFLFWQFLCWLYPESAIDLAVNWVQPQTDEKRAAVEANDASLRSVARAGTGTQPAQGQETTLRAEEAFDGADESSPADSDDRDDDGSDDGHGLLYWRADTADARTPELHMIQPFELPEQASAPQPQPDERQTESQGMPAAALSSGTDGAGSAAAASQGWRKFLGPMANNRDM